MNLTHHYPQQISSTNTRTTTFAIQELLGLTSTDLAAARAYADHQAYAAYLSRSSLFPSYQHPTGPFINADIPSTHHPHFLQQFSPTTTTLDSLGQSLDINSGDGSDGSSEKFNSNGLNSNISSKKKKCKRRHR
jgi:hypothetical protein